MAFLGAAEIDAEGNVNVSAFSDKVTGPGGFIDIAQNTQNVCFMSSFTAGGLQIDVHEGLLSITSEGRSRKFRKNVQQLTFSAKTALARGQRVLYITERAVFALTENGLMLTEIAPGLDLESDILGQMDFVPLISENLRQFDPAILKPTLMGLKERL